MGEIASYSVITESADPANLPMCKEIAEYLCVAYPGHPWHIRIDGGMLIIKNMRISDKWSMARKFSDIAHDAKKRKHDVVMAAGEFLEAANMRRAAMEAGQPVAQTLEGRQDKKEFRPLIEIKPQVLG